MTGASGNSVPGPAGQGEPEAVALTAAVCTRDRPRQLDRALASLVAQVSPVAEILVVVNSSARTADVDGVLEKYPTVRCELEPREGLDFARNRALAAARTEVVAYLDDDVVLDSGWSAALARGFAVDESIGVCTGRVLALELETEGQRIFEANGGYDRGDRPVLLPDFRGTKLHGWSAPTVAWAFSIGNGSSFAVRRELAVSLGGFDEALDLGSYLPGGGDHDMLWRVLQSGSKVLYVPDAVAYHEHRRAKEEVFRQIVGQQRGFVAMLSKAVRHTRGIDRIWVLGYLVWRIFKPGARILRRIAGRDPLPISVLMNMWWNCLRGPLCYLLAKGMAEKRRASAAVAISVGKVSVTSEADKDA